MSKSKSIDTSNSSTTSSINRNDSSFYSFANSSHGLVEKDQLKLHTTLENADTKQTSLTIVERLLPLWIMLACVFGLLLGKLKIVTLIISYTTTSGGTNLLVGAGLMLMMYPALAKVRWSSIFFVFSDYKLLGLTLGLNWIISPCMLFALSYLFFGGMRSGLMSGLSLVGCARCFAMVLVWNFLSDGDADYCAAIAALNSMLTVILYSPYVVFFVSYFPSVIGVVGDNVSISLFRVALCVLTYMGIPLVSAIIISFIMIRVKGEEYYYEVYTKMISPVTLVSLLFTVTVIFSSNSSAVLGQLPLALYAAVPMLIYFLVMFTVAFTLAHALKANYGKSCAIAFTAASNNLEIALAVAIYSFGLHSDESLMCVVAALIEIPTMLTLVTLAPYIRRRWYTTSTTSGKDSSNIDDINEERNGSRV